MIEVKLNETTTCPIEIHRGGYLRVSLTLDEAREVADGIFRHLGVRCSDQAKFLKENLELHEKVEALEAINAGLVNVGPVFHIQESGGVRILKKKNRKLKKKAKRMAKRLKLIKELLK